MSSKKPKSKFPGSKTLNKDVKILKKNVNTVNGKIKPYEKNPLTYTVPQRLALIAFFMLMLSFYTKYINFGHWLSIGFDMSSYPPESALFWIIGSTLAFGYGYYKEDKLLETLALVGFSYALIFTAGIINTYYYTWWIW